MPSLRGLCMTAFVLVFHFCCIATAKSGSAPLQLDLTVSPRTSRPDANLLQPRDGAPVTAPSIYGYDGILSIIVNATIGTPPQQIEFILATNAADTVVLAANDSTCNAHACGSAVFEPSQSSTYHFLNSNFSTTYEDGTAGTGAYVTDNFMLGGTSIPNLQFALLSSGSLNDATLGVGYTAIEWAANSYKNLPYRLYDQKAINVNAFSIWFEDESSTNGKLSFGGIDTGKFNGSLEAFTVSAASNLAYQFTTVAMSRISGTLNGKVTNFANSSANVNLDTSATSLYLPNTTITQIASFLGAVFDGAEYIIAYSAMKNGSTVDITLGSTTIHIPPEHLTAPGNATHAYVFLGTTNSDGSNSLGVPFLRNAYTVFDYTHNQISLAPLLISNQSNITSIPSAGVAGLTSTFKASSTNHTSSNSSSTASHSSTPTGHGLPSSAKLGIGLGLGLGIPFLLAVIGAVVLLRRRKHRQRQTTNEIHIPATAEAHNHAEPHSIGGVFGGLKTKFTPMKTSDMPELDGGYSLPHNNFGSPDTSAFSIEKSSNTSHTY